MATKLPYEVKNQGSQMVKAPSLTAGKKAGKTKTGNDLRVKGGN